MNESTEKPKAKVYIDGANIFYSQKKMGWVLDWVKVKQHLGQEKDVIEWRYYVGLREGDQKMLKYLRYLNAIGFNPITKPLKQIKVSDFERFPQAQSTGYIYKSNFDVEMSLDMVLDKASFSEVILFSGDSDFNFTVKKLGDLGKKAVVVSSKKTLSWELKLACSNVIYLEELKQKIYRDK